MVVVVVAEAGGRRSGEGTDVSGGAFGGDHWDCLDPRPQRKRGTKRRGGARKQMRELERTAWASLQAAGASLPADRSLG